MRDSVIYLTDKGNYLMNNEFPSEEITSINEFLDKIKAISEQWHDDCAAVIPWFRGSQKSNYKPVPSVFRDNGYDEFWMNMEFKNKAQTFGVNTPDFERVDLWLFMMQHLGLPTRLLDWTESPLIALYFALRDSLKNADDEFPAVWAIHPFKLNEFSIKKWVLPASGDRSQLGISYSQMAFFQFQNDESKRCFICGHGNDENLLTYPVAFQTSYVHPRMQAQKSVFTIHGFDRRNFEDIFIETKLVEEGYFKKIIIKDDFKKILLEIKHLGIDESVILPDLEGLARELKSKYKK